MGSSEYCLTFSEDSRLGIGVENPSACLEVNNPTGTVKALQVNHSSAVTFAAEINNVTGNDGLKIISGNSIDANEKILEVQNGNLDTKFRVLANGLTSVNTTENDATFNVDGTVKIYDENKLHLQGTSSNIGEIWAYDDSAKHKVAIKNSMTGTNTGVEIKTGGNNTRMFVNGDGNVGIGTTSPTELLDINGDTIRIRSSKTPSSSSDTGAAGEIAWDSNYIYICVATNTWKRTALASW